MLDPAPTVKEIDELLALYREGVKLAEEEEKILKEEPNDVIKNIEILAAPLVKPSPSGRLPLW